MRNWHFWAKLGKIAKQIPFLGGLLVPRKTFLLKISIRKERNEVRLSVIFFGHFAGRNSCGQENFMPCHFVTFISPLSSTRYCKSLSFSFQSLLSTTAAASSAPSRFHPLYEPQPQPAAQINEKNRSVQLVCTQPQ